MKIHSKSFDYHVLASRVVVKQQLNFDDETGVLRWARYVKPIASDLPPALQAVDQKEAIFVVTDRCQYRNVARLVRTLDPQQARIRLATIDQYVKQVA